MGAALGPGRVQPTAVAREALQHVLARGHFFRRGEGEGEGGNVRVEYKYVGAQTRFKVHCPGTVNKEKETHTQCTFP